MNFIEAVIAKALETAITFVRRHPFLTVALIALWLLIKLAATIAPVGTALAAMAAVYRTIRDQLIKFGLPRWSYWLLIAACWIAFWPLGVFLLFCGRANAAAPTEQTDLPITGK